MNSNSELELETLGMAESQGRLGSEAYSRRHEHTGHFPLRKMAKVPSRSTQERHTRPSDISRGEADTHMETRIDATETAMEEQYRQGQVPARGLDNSVINDINMLSHNHSIT